MNRLKLVLPTPSYKEKLMEYKREFIENEDSMDGTAGLRNAETFEEWYSAFCDNLEEETVRDGLVPATTYMAISSIDDRLIGMIDIRHRLNDYLLNFGGHIGYCVRKSERRQGYATEMLALALKECIKLNIEKVLITCDKDNVASAKTIINNGGILENEISEGNEITQRYWITLDNNLVQEEFKMDFLELAKQRCTTRGFTDKRIGKDDLDRILSAGRVAPTACNKQPQRIIVVQHRDNILKVQKAYQTFGSQCIFIVCQDKKNPLIRPFDEKCSGDLDIGIICDHMMLAARELNIGSVMVGLFDPHIIRKEFFIPEHIEPTALLILGYPANGFLSPDRHKTERKPLEDVVMYEKYSEDRL